MTTPIYDRLKAKQFYHLEDEVNAEVLRAHNRLLQEAIANPPPVNVGEPGTRGIVTAVGGTLYFKCAYIGVRILREHGCTLPIEWWHLGGREMDPVMKRLAEELGVTVVDATKIGYKPRILNGWELKPFAVAHSRFQEVLFLDADNLAVRDPTFMFDVEGYKRTGSMFWPDLPPQDRPEWVPTEVWRLLGVTRPGTPAFESGQFMVDKGRCARELGVTVHINEYSDWYYKWATYGDKDTFQIAWRVCGTDYAMPVGACSWDAPAIQQYAPDGSLLFQHLCQGKNRLSTGQFIPSLRDATSASRFAFELSSQWHGRIWHISDSDLTDPHVHETLTGAWTLTRSDSRDAVGITLLPGGSIGDGSSNTEYAWSVNKSAYGQPMVVIVGSGHKGTQVATATVKEGLNGVWRGNMNGVIVRLGRPPLSKIFPFYWSYREDTYDWGIFNAVVVADEYGLSGMVLDDGAVIDIGAHIGSFAYKARQVGAGVIHCYEPEPDNYRLLTRNASFVGCKTFNEAVWSRTTGVRLEKGRCNNTGANYTFDDPSGSTPAVDLATAIDRVLADSGKDRVALLKLDCEGAEFEILPNADLSKVDRVVAETHDSRRTPELLVYLTKCGFNVEHRHAAGDLGFLTAWR